MDLEDFIIESNKIEGEQTLIESELPVYKWLLDDDIDEKRLKEFHKRICDARGQLSEGYRGHYRKVPVYIGNKEFPKPGSLNRLMTQFWEDFWNNTPFENHKRFENIHPFIDLNGRTGRALWLWQMGGECDLGFLHQFYYQSLSSK